MKKRLLTLSILTGAIVVAQSASAATSLSPIPAERSNAFKTDPAITLRADKHSQADLDKALEEVKSQILEADQNGVLTRIKDAAKADGFTYKLEIESAQFAAGKKFVAATYTGTYNCDAITLKANETCENGTFKAKGNIMVNVDPVLDETYAKNILETIKIAEKDASNEDKAKLAELIKKLEGIIADKDSVETPAQDVTFIEVQAGGIIGYDKYDEIYKKVEKGEATSTQEEQKADNKSDKNALGAPNTGFEVSDFAPVIGILATILLSGTAIAVLKR